MINSDSIKSKLKNIAMKENKQFDYLLTLYSIERMLYRLSISKYSDRFILKGGVLLYTLLEDKARATKDVDLLAKRLDNSIDNISNIFHEICLIEVDDAIRFDVGSLKAEKIKEDANYEGVRIKVTAYLDRTKKIVQLDIGFGDKVIPNEVDMEYPSLLDMDHPIIKAYSTESVIAEKFEAMIYLAEANSRMKDFYDIYSLSSLNDYEGEILLEAIKSTFEARKTTLPEKPIIFQDNFGNLHEKQIQWNAFKRRISSKTTPEFSEIINSIKIFLEPIYLSIARNDNYIKRWNADEQRWI